MSVDITNLIQTVDGVDRLSGENVDAFVDLLLNGARQDQRAVLLKLTRRTVSQQVAEEPKHRADNACDGKRDDPRAAKCSDHRDQQQTRFVDHPAIVNVGKLH